MGSKAVRSAAAGLVIVVDGVDADADAAFLDETLLPFTTALDVVDSGRTATMLGFSNVSS